MTQDEEETALAVYQTLRDRGGFSSEEELSLAAGLTAGQVRSGRRRLEHLGLVEVKEDQLVPVEPDAALVRTMEAHRAGALEQARRDAEAHEVWRSLMSVYRPVAHREASQVEVEYLTDRRRKNRALVSLNAMTRRFSDSMHPGPMPPMALLAESLREDAKLVDRGVRVRAIYPQSLLQSPKYARYLHDLTALGAEVRLIGHAPCDLLIFDRSYASLPADPDDRNGPMLLVRGSALATSYVAFYEDFWLRAVPYGAAAADGPTGATGLTAQERTVVRLLAGGLSDDQIARRMGVHRRTVQRTVAKLMERLHASSRFEAGVKLAQDPAFARALRAPAQVPVEAPGPP
ncbi:helix-turn-helix transcriptional regulator [Streptomyces sp. V4-01]|uniref:Helix-turn-helix transcriptional regulator n=1 Tax=Actinacidiphila polyblastidii TaxID=3110430 RepID=A0ABU7PJ03_9ACTN|nr:helix-turn-helix transcriptional regulator [Streptomyces sp. V4-01]